ncbi:MAG: cell division protein FtsL [Gammaproteobacteria bacterium]|nr:cell division protein FtsL [Gammaproteobacteria bacterium]
MSGHDVLGDDWINGWLVTIGIALLVSAIAIVYVTHQTRSLFVEAQSLNAERDALEIEWNRLRLEHSTWATHGRVEQLARDELDMRQPGADDIVVIENVESDN